jgi:hypothetical protein
MPRIQITPEEFKRSKLVKPGWYPTLIKDVNEELNSKKDGNNIVVDVECADKDTEFIGVPAKLWFTEKYVTGIVNFFKAFNPKANEAAIADFEFNETKGKYIYGKWATNRGKDGTDPPRNTIEDWAPLPAKYEFLNKAAEEGVVAGVAGFGQ